MAKKTTKKTSTAKKVTIGIGLTTAAVAAAGAYFLYGSKNAAKNRKAVKSWMLKAKAEVLEALEKAEKMSKEEYEAVVDAVSKGYANLKGASKADISAFKKEMKEHWTGIERSAGGSAKKTAKKKTAKKVVAKKTAKKSTKKAS